MLKSSNTPIAAQIQLSSKIILAPIPDSQKTVFVSVKNISQHDKLKINDLLQPLLKQKGYKIMPNAKLAQYVLQLNVIQSGRTLENYFKNLVEKGFSSDLMNSNDTINPLPITKDNIQFQKVITTMTVDVQISERIQFQNQTDQNNTQSTTWNRYQTRIASQINIQNAVFKQARPLLTKSIAEAIADLF